MIKTAEDSINDLLEILGPSRDVIVSQTQLDMAMQAMSTQDSTLAAQVLAELFDEVAKQAAGLQLDKLDSEEFGKKVGWIVYKAHSRGTMLNYLAKYKRDLAETPMKQAIQAANAHTMVNEVIREAVGPTCQWCLERCGIWTPNDANAYGVWARHAGCDCTIYVRKVKEET